MKIDIISGFLGAGKTTFIKRLLKTKLKNEKVVLIENEFGEVSVDSLFLADSKIDIKELSQGCICCSLFGDFSKSLNEVVDRFHPDRILIEPSGVGKLSDIIEAVADAHLEQNLNALVCMVDVSKAKMYSKNFGEFFLDQIKAAHTVILSRTDVAKEEKVTEALEIIREYNHDAVLVTTPIASLTDEELCKAYEGIHDNFLHELMESLEHEHHHHDDEECECGHHHHHDEEECECGHHHHHDEEECECGHHHHHDEEECECGHHHHHDEEECECGHHHHHDDEECECGHHHHHHHADEVFSSVGFETAKKYDIDVLKEILNAMAEGEYGLIVRAKGVVSDLNGAWHEFNLTPGEVEVIACSVRPIGKICVIGSKIDEHQIKDLF
ncbi:MAG: CobW family GTP-binding protein [Roseburia sp.]|nr:CobW family GTP-binding protein [Anaeroplasma bactoclasticum]MCM1195755.1 CobW family GTP-binding protein [Roseburia sp.]MCM1556980.1 CobW family GTP-binding protein [Anaeroplasma bactoclasticum]